MFLFSVLVCIARKVVKNRCYVNEKVFEFKDNVKMRRDRACLTLCSDKVPFGVNIITETVSNAFRWEKYINFSMREKFSVVQSPTDGFRSTDDSEHI